MVYRVIISKESLEASRIWLEDREYDHKNYMDWSKSCESGKILETKLVGSRWTDYFDRGFDSNVEVFFHERFKRDAMEFKLTFGIGDE